MRSKSWPRKETRQPGTAEKTAITVAPMTVPTANAEDSRPAVPTETPSSIAIAGSNPRSW